MELVRQECDFPVIGGQQGSLLGLLCVFMESRMVLQCFPCLQRGGKDDSSPAWRSQALLGVASMGRLGSSWAVRFSAWGQEDLGHRGSKAGTGQQRKAVTPAPL